MLRQKGSDGQVGDVLEWWYYDGMVWWYSMVWYHENGLCEHCFRISGFYLSDGRYGWSFVGKRHVVAILFHRLFIDNICRKRTYHLQHHTDKTQEIE